MKTTEYQGFAVGIVGTNGIGKTYFCDKIIKSYKRPILALLDDDSEMYFNDFYDLKLEQVKQINKGKFKLQTGFNKKGKEKAINEVYENFNQNPKKGGLIFIDDAMTLFDARPQFAFPIFKKRRQKHFDILLNCHGFSEFPISLIKNMTSFVFGQTLDSISGNSNRINKQLAENINSCIKIVNEGAKHHSIFKLEFDVKNPTDFTEIWNNDQKMREIVSFCKVEHEKFKLIKK